MTYKDLTRLKTMIHQNYMEFFEHMITYLRAKGYTVRSGNPFGDGTGDPQYFNPTTIHQRRVVIQYKETDIEIYLSDYEYAADIMVWEHLPPQRKLYQERYSPQDWNNNVTSRYMQKVRRSKDYDLEKLLSKVCKKIDKSLPIKKLREKEVADGHGRRVLY